ncbi:MAG: lysophospholipid acyltransferase family protein [Woeseiaceae bacterium]|nr:lysophospholipid acyltransferase family protein [Woeseiaceae bacterium]
MPDNPSNGGARTAGTTRPLAVLYGVYAWLAFVTCVLGSLACAVLVPGLERRRRCIAAFARLPFRLAGIAVEIRGSEHLPATQSIIVANHASYLDGVILQAFMPERFSYVIKGEMQNVPVVHFLLRRLGARFVNRNDPDASSRDARTLIRAADSGESLAFFPEGTFVPEPGLGAFRPGAFAAARRSALPVVPVAISGARHILPAERLLPRRGPLTIEILEPLPPDAAASTRELADLARQRLLESLGEADLAPCTATPDTGK